MIPALQFNENIHWAQHRGPVVASTSRIEHVSSLHNIIFNSFRVVLVLWRLFFLFLSYVIVVQKKFLWIMNKTITLERGEKILFSPLVWSSGKTFSAIWFLFIRPSVSALWTHLISSSRTDHIIYNRLTWNQAIHKSTFLTFYFIGLIYFYEPFPWLMLNTRVLSPKYTHI